MLSAAEFDRLAEAALRDIPKRFCRRVENVATIVEQEPPRPGLLGLYQGHPFTRRSVFQGFAMPDRITIYQGLHERMSRTPTELKKMVADTTSGWTNRRFGEPNATMRDFEIGVLAHLRVRQLRPPNVIPILPPF